MLILYFFVMYFDVWTSDKLKVGRSVCCNNFIHLYQSNGETLSFCLSIIRSFHCSVYHWASLIKEPNQMAKNSELWSRKWILMTTMQQWEKAVWFGFLITDSGTSGVLDISLELAPYCKAGSYWLREVSQSVIGGHWMSLIDWLVDWC